MISHLRQNFEASFEIKFSPGSAKQLFGQRRTAELAKAIRRFAESEARQGREVTDVDISCRVQRCAWNPSLANLVFVTTVTIFVIDSGKGSPDHDVQEICYWTNHPDDVSKSFSILGTVSDADALHKSEVLNAVVAAVQALRGKVRAA
jgi:hypothetical protein